MNHGDSPEDEIGRLRRRLDRERRARAEAEAIAEKGTRLLYDRQLELELLHLIADSANSASSVETAIEVALDRICAYTGWPVGHACMVDTNPTPVLVTTALWHLENPERFAAFRQATEKSRFSPGDGLPGRVLATRRSSWIVDVEKDDNFPRHPAAAAAGLHGAFAFPILAGDEVFAVLEFFSRESAEVDERRLKIATQVGTQLGRIFERRRADQALRAGEARFREVVENISEAFWMTDLEQNRVLYVSPRFEQIWKQPRENLLASPLSWMESIHSDDKERVALAAMPGPEESYRIIRSDNSLRWIRHRSYLVRDESAGNRRLISVAEDITDKKRMEEQFLRAQRVDAIGSLASGIAHDLNNILAPVLIAAAMLKGEVADKGSIELLSMIENGTKRGAEVVKQLLTFSRGMEGKRALVPPRPLLSEMVSLIRETFPRDLTLIVEGPENLPVVLADATQIHQVLMNLCVNARDAMPDGGRLTLGANLVELSPRDLHLHADAKSGPYVVLTVADTGKGIRPEVLARIFDPFFTTKELGKGTGLGLSTALGIVRSHGGFITVYSEPGSGTVFRVYLPAAMQASAGEGGPEVKAALAGSGELILVVDDEPPIREATRLLLEKHHYQVLTAVNGREALAKFVQQQESIQLVLTDMMMPVMAGLPLVRALRALDPKVRIVAASGLDDQGKWAELAALGVQETLIKPCTPDQLLGAVRRQLNTS